MTLFRPCIDLHDGRVKQIVGGSLKDDHTEPQTNFVAQQGPDHFAQRYRSDGLRGGHVIKLGPGNDKAARAALNAFPDGLQLGGGIDATNAAQWIAAGAAKVIVTSWLFQGDELSLARAEALAQSLGKQRVVIDLSCRRVDRGFRVATNRWQTVTATLVNGNTLTQLSEYCSEYLVHAADVEGKQQGIDEELVKLLANESPLRCTYAGGARNLDDLERVERLSAGRVDLTIGSALDLFGGNGARYADCVAWNQRRRGT